MLDVLQPVGMYTQSEVFGRAWQEWFYPILEVISEEVNVWAKEGGRVDMLREPVFLGDYQVELRPDYLDLDASMYFTYRSADNTS